MEVGRVVRLHGHVGHARIEVTCADGMSRHFVLLQDGFVVLAVFAQLVAVGSAPGLLDEVLGHPQVFLVVGDLVELDQCHFDDGVSGGHVLLSFAGAEYLAYQVGVLDGYVKQGTFAGGPVMGYCRFVEVAAVIEFVAVELFPFGASPPAGQAVTLVGDTGCQVAVRLLGGGDDGDDAVQILVELRVVADGQRVGRALYHLVVVCVVERKVAPVLTFLQAGGDGKIVEAAVLLAFAEG